jgi:hypothetical protein
MDNRWSTAEKLIEYMEKRCDCDSVTKLASKKSLLGTEITYREISHDLITKDDLYSYLHFITDANNLGFTYFPYLYGVLACSNTRSVHIFMEYYPSTLQETIMNLKHNSEWYDLLFQLLIITSYLDKFSPFSHNGNMLSTFFCNRLDKPYYTDYKINNQVITINHLFNIFHFDTSIQEKNTSNYHVLLLLDQISNILPSVPTNVTPSPNIIKLLDEIKNNPDNLSTIIYNWYRTKNKSSE